MGISDPGLGAGDTVLAQGRESLSFVGGHLGEWDHRHHRQHVSTGGGTLRPGTGHRAGTGGFSRCLFVFCIIFTKVYPNSKQNLNVKYLDR